MDWQLHYRTPDAWAEPLRAHLPELLQEQAQLEKKAAAAASTLLFRLPMDLGSHRALSRLAREELVHFERTLRLLEQRGIALASVEPGPYAERLKAAMLRTMPERLLDELLIAALIEARSHERMALLADALLDADAEVAAFYRDLLAAEDRHRQVYVEVATAVFAPAQVGARLLRLLAHEAAVMQALPWLPRLHGGMAVTP
jgi:tRNA-(ms[2]io[6]A)-hydroxylase